MLVCRMYECLVMLIFVHPVAVFNVAFCITCSLLMLVEDERTDHLEEANYRASLMSAL